MRRKTCDEFFTNKINPDIWYTYGDTYEACLKEVRKQLKNYVYLDVLSILLGVVGICIVSLLYIRLTFIPLILRVYLDTVFGGFSLFLIMCHSFVRFRLQTCTTAVQLPYLLQARRKSCLVKVVDYYLGAEELALNIKFIPGKHMIHREDVGNELIAVYGRALVAQNTIVITEVKYAIPDNTRSYRSVYSMLYCRTCRVWFVVEVLICLGNYLLPMVGKLF